MSLTVQQVLTQATKQLADAGLDTPDLDARLLLLHATGLTKEQVFLNGEQAFPADRQEEFDAFIEQRLSRKPVSKIIGEREFWSLPFKVTEDTLDPRPDSETLIEAVLKQAGERTTLLDLGTGTGCLLLTLLSELPKTTGIGVDISQKALSVAQENAERLNLNDRSSFILSNWFENVDRAFDVLISNPPYIPTSDLDDLEPEVTRYDPAGALDGGADGLTAYRHLITHAPAHLNKDGLIALELGIHQADDVENLLKTAGFKGIERHFDLSGVARVLTALK